jgi:hypothetical protein
MGCCVEEHCGERSRDDEAARPRTGLGPPARLADFGSEHGHDRQIALGFCCDVRWSVTGHAGTVLAVTHAPLTFASSSGLGIGFRQW